MLTHLDKLWKLCFSKKKLSTTCTVLIQCSRWPASKYMNYGCNVYIENAIFFNLLMFCYTPGKENKSFIDVIIIYFSLHIFSFHIIRLLPAELIMSSDQQVKGRVQVKQDTALSQGQTKSPNIWAHTHSHLKEMYKLHFTYRIMSLDRNKLK